MNVTEALRRARATSLEEVRFRTAGAFRIHRERLKQRVRASRWDRGALAASLATERLPDLLRLIRSGEWDGAEALLAEHFSPRASVWPIPAREKEAITRSITAQFPSAAADAGERAERILGGQYDLLGHRDLPYGRIPDWHRDAAHGRTAPRRFWADVPYLDPACGDHKVTWELNRHQHWTTLGRAFWLRGDGRYAEAFVDQFYSWLDANPPLVGVNWASMLELAFRAISWTWALEFFTPIDAAAAKNRPWRLDLLLALDRQLAHVSENLSRYFSPNTHLSGEALALYVVSLAFPELRASAARAALGREILLQEADRQVLPDGGHAERSTHYHRYSADFYLLAAIVARRSGDPAAASLTAAAKAQAEVLRTFADDSGGLQTIGDDDGGQLFAMCGTAPSDVRTTLAIAAELLSDPSLAVSPPTEESWWVLQPRSLAASRGSLTAPSRWRSRLLPDTGYFVSRGTRELAIFDVGRHGFLNGGHAHADALAIVTTAAAKPLLIDPGTGTYTMDPSLRDRLRAGRMHNTVLIDGEEHAAVRGPFHWSRTTDARALFSLAGDGWDIAQGMHDGYPECRHVRTLFSVHDVGWLVVDQILGTGRHRAEAFWHVAPDWRLTPCDGGIALEHVDGSRSILASTAETTEIVERGPDAIYAPEYGRVAHAPFIRTVHASNAPLTFATFLSSTAELDVTGVSLAVQACPAPGGWVGAAVVVSSTAREIVAVTAAPERPAGNWPGAPFGVPQLQTDQQAALLVRDRVIPAISMAPAVHEVSR
jgi:hypothetical protein